jgi:hypothetical protein
MRTIQIISILLALALAGNATAQDSKQTAQVKVLKIQRLVHDQIGKSATLNLTNGETRSGVLLRVTGEAFILGVNGAEEQCPISNVRSLTIGPGISEGILVALSSLLVGGFGWGVAELSFNGRSSTAQGAVAIVFAILGGWTGYDSFFQKIEIEMPR